MASLESSAPVYVLSCRGGTQGELGVVRSLGRAGIRVVVVSEYETISRLSKYCDRCHVFPSVFDDEKAGIDYLLELAAAEPEPPVLFPTADPDLVFISRNRQKLETRFRLFVSDEHIVEALIDKGRFFEFAMQHALPTPNTYTLKRSTCVAEAVAGFDFPVILKPLIPQSWGKQAIARIVSGKKAVLVQTLAELEDLHRRISEIDDRLAMQEYIPGRDDRLFSLHAYISHSGRVVEAFTGQKIRTYPPYAGIGCYVKSVDKPELKALGLDVLERIGYRGLALAQFKQHSETGEYYLLEINPRLSSWNALATACGIDLPFAAYCDCVGRPLPVFGPQTTGRNYMFFEHDLSAMREYVRNGDLTIREWLGSLFAPNVQQYLAFDDLSPYFAATGNWLSRQVMKLGR